MRGYKYRLKDLDRLLDYYQSHYAVIENKPRQLKAEFPLHLTILLRDVQESFLECFNELEASGNHYLFDKKQFRKTFRSLVKRLDVMDDLIVPDVTNMIKYVLFMVSEQELPTLELPILYLQRLKQMLLELGEISTKLCSDIRNEAQGVSDEESKSAMIADPIVRQFVQVSTDAREAARSIYAQLSHYVRQGRPVDDMSVIERKSLALAEYYTTTTKLLKQTASSDSFAIQLAKQPENDKRELLKELRQSCKRYESVLELLLKHMTAGALTTSDLTIVGNGRQAFKISMRQVLEIMNGPSGQDLVSQSSHQPSEDDFEFSSVGGIL